MHNWSVDLESIRKDPKKFAAWRLEQLVNFGTDGEKISASELKCYWDELRLDPRKKRFLGLLLWGEKFLQADS